MRLLRERARDGKKRASAFQVGILAAFAGCAVGIAVASLLGTSPGEARRARAIPQLPTPTVSVVEQVLRDEARAPCEPLSRVTEVMAPRLPAGTPRVVTSIGVRTGDTVGTGDHLATVSGVPILAFVTRIPFYRDLGVGDTGPDVAALERALVVAGKLARADSVFDGRTAQALKAIYATAHAATPPLTDQLRLASSVSLAKPSQVREVNVTVGQLVPPKQPLMVLGGRDSTLLCQVPQSVRVSAGDRLRLGDVPGQVVVRSVGAADQTSGQREVVVAAPDDAALGRSLDVVIPLDATRGAVLTVPVGAIWTGADGTFVVRKVVDGRVQTVTVDIGTTAGGFAEISGEGLAAGDEVQLHADLDGRAEAPLVGG
jgi:hypothetical protein